MVTVTQAGREAQGGASDTSREAQGGASDTSRLLLVR